MKILEFKFENQANYKNHRFANENNGNHENNRIHTANHKKL